MKTSILLFLFLFISTFQCLAHDKITFKTKDSFNKSCENGQFCSTFDLGIVTDKASYKATASFIKDNAAILQATAEGSIVHLSVLSNKMEKVIYQKLFYQMGLQEIEILEGDAKGIYSVDEFLNLYNL